MNHKVRNPASSKKFQCANIRLFNETERQHDVEIKDQRSTTHVIEGTRGKGGRLAAGRFRLVTAVATVVLSVAQPALRKLFKFEFGAKICAKIAAAFKFALLYNFFLLKNSDPKGIVNITKFD